MPGYCLSGRVACPVASCLPLRECVVQKVKLLLQAGLYLCLVFGSRNSRSAVEKGKIWQTIPMPSPTSSQLYCFRTIGYGAGFS